MTNGDKIRGLDDLVMRLREPCQYENCVLCKEASDAIEELQQAVGHYKGCADDWYREACDYKALCEQMKAAVIVEAEHTEMYDERDMKTLIEMAKSLPLRLVPNNDSNPRWISVEERLPEEPYGCLLIVWDSPYGGGDDFLNYLPYFAGWDGEQWNDGDGMQVPFEVAYWMPLPEIPKEDE